LEIDGNHVPDGDVALTSPTCEDGSRDLRQRRTDSNDSQPDQQLTHAEEPCDYARALHEVHTVSHYFRHIPALLLRPVRGRFRFAQSGTAILQCRHNAGMTMRLVAAASFAMALTLGVGCVCIGTHGGSSGSDTRGTRRVAPCQTAVATRAHSPYT
jgi:hypothetical protein